MADAFEEGLGSKFTHQLSSSLADAAHQNISEGTYNLFTTGNFTTSMATGLSGAVGGRTSHLLNVNAKWLGSGIRTHLLHLGSADAKSLSGDVGPLNSPDALGGTRGPAPATVGEGGNGPLPGPDTTPHPPGPLPDANPGGALGTDSGTNADTGTGSGTGTDAPRGSTDPGPGAGTPNRIQVTSSDDGPSGTASGNTSSSGGTDTTGSGTTNHVRSPRTDLGTDHHAAPTPDHTPPVHLTPADRPVGGGTHTPAPGADTAHGGTVRPAGDPGATPVPHHDTTVTDDPTAPATTAVDPLGTRPGQTQQTGDRSGSQLGGDRTGDNGAATGADRTGTNRPGAGRQTAGRPEGTPTPPPAHAGSGTPGRVPTVDQHSDPAGDTRATNSPEPGGQPRPQVVGGPADRTHTLGGDGPTRTENAGGDNARPVSTVSDDQAPPAERTPDGDPGRPEGTGNAHGGSQHPPQGGDPHHNNTHNDSPDDGHNDNHQAPPVHDGLPEHLQDPSALRAKSDEWNQFRGERDARYEAYVDAAERHGDLTVDLNRGYDRFASEDLFGGRNLPQDGVEAQQAREDYHKEVHDAFQQVWHDSAGTGKFDEARWQQTYTGLRAGAARHFARADAQSRQTSLFTSDIDRAVSDFRQQDLFGGRHLPEGDDAATVLDPEAAGHKGSLGPDGVWRPDVDRHSEDSYEADDGKPKPGDADYTPRSVDELREDQNARIRGAVASAFRRFGDDLPRRDAAIESQLRTLREELPGRLNRISEAERHVHFATRDFDSRAEDNADDIAGGHYLSQETVDRTRAEFQDDVRQFYHRMRTEADLADARPDARFGARWDTLLDGTVRGIPDRFAHAEFRDRHTRSAQEALADAFTHHDADVFNRTELGADGRDRVARQWRKDVDAAIDKHWFKVLGQPDFRARPTEAGDEGQPTPRPWQETFDDLVAKLPGRLDHESALQTHVARSAGDFHRLVGDRGGDLNRLALDDETIRELGDTFRTDTLTAFDTIWAPQAHNITAWLHHETHHENAFRATTDRLNAPPEPPRPPSHLPSSPQPSPESSPAGEASPDSPAARPPQDTPHTDSPTSGLSMVTVHPDAPPVRIPTLSRADSDNETLIGSDHHDGRSESDDDLSDTGTLVGDQDDVAVWERVRTPREREPSNPDSRGHRTTSPRC